MEILQIIYKKIKRDIKIYEIELKKYLKSESEWEPNQ
jgi:hypothetical protein